MSQVISEALYLFPDSILFGSALMGLTTLSLPHTAFFISILINLVVLFGLQSTFSFINGSSVPSLLKCKPRLFNYTFEQLFLRPSASTPSYGMFIVSYACAYLATSLYMMRDELDILDISKLKQYYISIGSLFAVAFIYLMIRLMNECDTMGSTTSGFLFGGILGVVSVNIVIKLFDKDALNFLGIPLLRNKTNDGAPIYICS